MANLNSIANNPYDTPSHPWMPTECGMRTKPWALAGVPPTQLSYLVKITNRTTISEGKERKLQRKKTFPSLNRDRDQCAKPESSNRISLILLAIKLSRIEERDKISNFNSNRKFTTKFYDTPQGNRRTYSKVFSERKSQVRILLLVNLYTSGLMEKYKHFVTLCFGPLM